MKFKFIASGITFDTGVNKEEVEYNVQQTINEELGGYARFNYEKINDNMPIALKRYHCSVVSGTNVALRAVPLVAL